MHVVVCSPIPGIAIEISVALGAVDIDCEAEPSLQEFGSLLFRDPDAIGVFWSMGPASAAETCRRLRMGDIHNPLFAVIEEMQPETGGAGRALALLAGADDIQPWPLHPAELVARLFALARRKRIIETDVYALPGCIFHPGRGELIGATGSIVHLTKQEATLLAALASRPGMLITKAMCMLALYQGRSEAEPKIVDVFACKLRKKIAAATGGLDCIETVWGQGFRFVSEGYRPEVGSFGKRVIG